MALLPRPAGHVLGTNVTGEDLVATDFRQRVVTKARLAIMVHPFERRGGNPVLHQRSERLAAKRRQGHADASDQAALQKGAPGYITVGHA